MRRRAPGRRPGKAGARYDNPAVHIERKKIRQGLLQAAKIVFKSSLHPCVSVPRRTWLNADVDEFR